MTGKVVSIAEKLNNSLKESRLKGILTFMFSTFVV